MDSVPIGAEKWVQNGYTIGHDPDGRAVFIHGAIPGKTFSVRRIAGRETHSFGIAMDGPAWEGASDCPSFPLCGGCSFRHIPYEEEKKIKIGLLRELNSISDAMDGGFRYIDSHRDGYRNHIRIQSREGMSGFFRLLSHEVIPFRGCRNLSPELNQAVLSHSGFPESGESRFRQTSDGIFGPEDLLNREFLEEKVGLWRWYFPPQGFFQSNRFLIVPWLEGLSSMIGEAGSDAVELFCGSGLIGGFLRQKLGRYTGIESDRNALRAAKRNFSLHGFEGRFIGADLYRSIPELRGAELIIVNPPRSGLNRSLIDGIAATARQIIYSSCNPHTLNRDLTHFFKRGFRADPVTVFDFFPATPHLEMAVSLRR